MQPPGVMKRYDMDGMIDNVRGMGDMIRGMMDMMGGGMMEEISGIPLD